MKNVLVTGAGGFIGSHLCELLAARGVRVTALVHYNSRGSWGWLERSPAAGTMRVVLGDVRNYDSVYAAMKGADTVFHLAALIGIPYSYQSPDSYVDTNVRGTLNVLQAARALGTKKVVHTSTSEVYGTAQFVPITELHPVNPQSPYSATKAAADFLALSFFRSFELPVAVVRPFNAYGPRQSLRAVIPTIITQLLAGATRIKLGSLTPTRDLTYVKDTAQGFFAAAESSAAVGEVTNLGSGFEISMQELALRIAALLKVKVRFASDPCRVRPAKSEVERLLADTVKSQGLLGWRPAYSLDEGLRSTIRWFKTHAKEYKHDLYHV